MTHTPEQVERLVAAVKGIQRKVERYIAVTHPEADPSPEWVEFGRAIAAMEESMSPEQWGRLPDATAIVERFTSPEPPAAPPTSPVRRSKRSDEFDAIWSRYDSSFSKEFDAYELAFLWDADELNMLEAWHTYDKAVLEAKHLRDLALTDLRRRVVEDRGPLFPPPEPAAQGKGSGSTASGGKGGGDDTDSDPTGSDGPRSTPTPPPHSQDVDTENAATGNGGEGEAGINSGIGGVLASSSGPHPGLTPHPPSAKAMDPERCQRCGGKGADSAKDGEGL